MKKSFNLFSRRFVFVSSFFIFMFLAAVPVAQSEIFPARPTRFVTDQAGILNPQNKQQVEAILMELKQKTGAEIAVLTLKSIDGGSVEDVAIRVFEKWGIGQKGKDNGVLLLVAVQERKMRIEVGYGLEGIIPDGMAGQIRDESILPYFRQGDMNRGILTGTLSLARIIAKDAGVQITGLSMQQGHRRSRQRRELSLAQKIFGIIFIIIMIPVVIRHPWILLFLLSSGRGGRLGGGGGFGGGGFGGFGGGMSGGGGASGGW